MSINTTTRKAGPFAGNGVQTVFPFGFKVFAAGDVLVVRADSAGTETTLTLTTDYTVTLNPDQDAAPGGDITLAAPLAVGETLAATSQVAPLQPVTVTNGGGFFAAVFNGVFDRLTILTQQLAEKISRTMTIPLTASGVSLQVPVRAGAVLQWSADGSRLEAITLPNLALYLALPNMAGKAGQVLTNDGVSTGSWTTTLNGFSLGDATLTHATLAGKVTQSSNCNPTGVTGVFNDYAPAAGVGNAAFDDCSVLRITTSGLTTITGFAAGSSALGRRVLLENRGTSPIVLMNNHAGSAAGNRLFLPTPSQSVLPGQVVEMLYVGTGWKLTITGREQLQLPRTYYVSTTGNDTNDGLTPATAFLTVQRAIAVASGLDLNGQTVTIQLANGTYAGLVNVLPMVGQQAASQLVIQGDTATPGNVVFSAAAGSVVYAGAEAQARIVGVKFTGAGAEYLRAEYGGTIEFGNVEFGATSQYHILGYSLGIARAIANYTISGGAAAHWRSTFAGHVLATGRTITLTGTPALTTFAEAALAGTMQVNGNTFSGTATGTRYSVSTNGVLFTQGAGATYLPGSVAGATATGGQYV